MQSFLAPLVPLVPLVLKFRVLFLLFFMTPVIATESSIRVIYVSTKPNIEHKEGSGGYAELATLLKSARAKNPETLFLHGGDSLGPSLLSSFDRGAHMMDILNSLETSAMAVGQREFSYYEDELTLRTSEADFPILSANIFDPLNNGNLEGVISGYLFEAGGIKIGITAMVSDEMVTNYLPKRVSVLDADRALRKASSELRSEGADLIILMTDYESVYGESWLEDRVVELVLATSNVDIKNKKYKTVGDGMLVTYGWDDGVALDIEISLENNAGKTRSNYKIDSRVLSDYEPDKQVQQQIDQHLGVLSVLLDKELGFFGSEVNTLRHFVRTRESQFGNLIADALKQTSKVDVGFLNGGSIRGDRIYKKGEKITRKTLQQELPFRDSVAILSVTGEQLLQALENGFSAIEEARGRFPQVSGIQIKMSPTAPVGQRVLSVLVNNEPLDKDATYRLATTSFLAAGGDGFTSFKSAKHLQETVGEQIISDIVSAYVLAHKTVSPKIEGRILQVENTPSSSN